MSATDALRAPLATSGTAETDAREDRDAPMSRDEVLGARLLFVDVRVRSLLMREARRRAVKRVFGVPPEDQSFLATLILIGAAATVLRGLAPPLPRPTRADAEIGASLLSAAFRGIGGAPSRNIPLAGALITFAVVSHSVRPAVAGSVHEVRALVRQVRAAFGSRYGR